VKHPSSRSPEGPKVLQMHPLYGGVFLHFFEKRADEEESLFDFLV
jgi:hypothetical protein